MRKTFRQLANIHGLHKLTSPKAGAKLPPDSQQANSDSMPVWTGTKYETWGEVRRRGWRYVPGDQHLPVEGSTVTTSPDEINTGISLRAVRVRRNFDNAEMVIPEKAYNALKHSVDETGKMKITLLEYLDS